MATSVSYNGSTYSIPANREPRGWGASLSSFLVDVAGSAINTRGGTFTLTNADINLGTTYGIVSKYIKYSAGQLTLNTSGTITVPNATDTLVGKATTDTLTNKTLISPTITGTGAIAGTFTGNLTGNVTGNVSGSSGSTTGNAATATALATARAINGTNFDGTAAITVTAAAGTLTGTTLNSSVVTSSLTTVGALNSGSITSGFGSIDIGADALTAGAGTFTSATGSTSVITPLLKAYDGNGLKFQENGGTEIGSATDSGAWTLGSTSGTVASVTTAGVGQTSTSSFSTTGNLGGVTVLSTNNGAVAGEGGAVLFKDSGNTGYAAIKGALTSGASNTTGQVVFFTRLAAADATLTNVGSIANTGAWTLGAANSTCAPLKVATVTQNNEVALIGSGETFGVSSGSTTTFRISSGSGGSGLFLIYSAALAASAVVHVGGASSVTIISGLGSTFVTGAPTAFQLQLTYSTTNSEVTVTAGSSAGCGLSVTAIGGVV